MYTVKFGTSAFFGLLGACTCSKYQIQAVFLFTPEARVGGIDVHVPNELSCNYFYMIICVLFA